MEQRDAERILFDSKSMGFEKVGPLAGKKYRDSTRMGRENFRDFDLFH